MSEDSPLSRSWAQLSTFFCRSRWRDGCSWLEWGWDLGWAFSFWTSVKLVLFHVLTAFASSWSNWSKIRTMFPCRSFVSFCSFFFTEENGPVSWAWWAMRWWTWERRLWRGDREVLCWTSWIDGGGGSETANPLFGHGRASGVADLFLEGLVLGLIFLSFVLFSIAAWMGSVFIRKACCPLFIFGDGLSI